MLPLAGAVSCRLSNKSLAGEQRQADLDLSSAAGIRLCVGMCLPPSFRRLFPPKPFAHARAVP